MEQEPLEDGSGECQQQAPCVSSKGKKESETEGL